MCAVLGGKTALCFAAEGDERKCEKCILQKAGRRISRVFEFFGDLSLSPSFVFRELEHVLIPEFGDLILGILRWLSSREWQEQIPRYSRDDSVFARALDMQQHLKSGQQVPGYAPFLRQGRRDDSVEAKGSFLQRVGL
jgi:hypothetical protein